MSDYLVGLKSAFLPFINFLSSLWSMVPLLSRTRVSFASEREFSMSVAMGSSIWERLLRFGQAFHYKCLVFCPYFALYSGWAYCRSSMGVHTCLSQN